MPQHAVTPFNPPTSPEWTVHPYADRDACWGCGLEPTIKTGGPFTPYQLCDWCNELRIVHRANQTNRR